MDFIRPQIRFLSDDLLLKIIKEACVLLETIGINLNHSFLLKQLAHMGCKCDFDKNKVWISVDIINKCLSTVPSQIKLWNIKGDKYHNLSGNNVHFTPGSAAIKIFDHKTKKIRLTTQKDMVDYGKIVEQLPNIDYSSTAIVPDDVPRETGDSIRLFDLLMNTTKAIVTGAFTINGFKKMLEMQLVVRETVANLKAKPFTIFSCCPTAPLKWSDVTSDNTAECAKYGIPVEFISMPLVGFVSPISLVGCMVQHTAETLSGVVISQITNPGAPVIWGGSPGVFDMRTMAPAIAAVDAQILNCCHAEIGKWLRIPTQAYIGLSDSKCLDAQAGFESGTGMYLAALAGINSLSGPGMLQFESAFSFEKLICDNDICGMARQLVKPIKPYEDDFPMLPLFEELMANKNLLTSDSTLKHFRDSYMPSPVIDRGSQINEVLLVDRAHKEVERLLDKFEKPNILREDQTKELEKLS